MNRTFVLAGAFALGTLIAEVVHIPPVVAAVVCVAVFGLGSRMKTAACVVAGFVLMAIALAGWRIESLDRAALARGGADAFLHGQVLARPAVDTGTMRFIFGVDRARIDGRPVRVRERVQVSVRPAPPRAPEAGDVLEVDARLAPLSSPHANAAERSAAARLRYGGVAARAFAHPSAIRRLGRAGGPLMAIARAGQRAVGRASSALGDREAGLFRGVVVGDRDGLDSDLVEDFRATGLSHLLAVSGENLAMFLGAVTALLAVARVRRRGRIVSLVVATISFMAITRFEPSVLRAGAMAAVGILGIAAGTKHHTAHALALAALGLMMWDPFLIHAAGFQLSALATVGLVFMAPRIRAWFPPGKLGTAASVTIAAQLAVTPLEILSFHRVPLVALPANLLAVPAIAPATVLGFAASTLGIAWTPAARALAVLSRPFLWWTASVAHVFSRVPHASIGTPSGALALFGVGGSVAVIIAALRFRRRLRGARIVLLAVAFAAVEVWSRVLVPAAPTHGFRVTALNVGQGEAILVQSPEGRTMLVDGGPDPQVLLTRLRAHGVRRIDLLVLTHPHADHVNGLIAAVERYPVSRELDDGEPVSPAIVRTYPRYLSLLTSHHVGRDVVRAGAAYELGSVTVRVIAPAHFFHGTDSDLNNDSVVLRLEYGKASVLLGGEVQQEGQTALLDTPGELRATVFKVPHHGSAKGVRAFFEATHAAVALVSVGPNDYGQPAISTLHWLSDLGMKTYRTDRSGDVTVTLSTSGSFSVRTSR